MADTLTTARLRYLDSASATLLTTSPAISAHLKTVRQSLVHDSDPRNIQPSTNRVCAACGNVLIPRWSCEPVTKRTRQDRLAAAWSDVKLQQLRCDKCARVTVVESKRVRGRDVASRNEELKVNSVVERNLGEGNGRLDLQTVDKKVKKSAAARRNQRGKKESLLSMLEKQKKADKSAAGGLGLDLMDFIKH